MPVEIILAAFLQNRSNDYCRTIKAHRCAPFLEPPSGTAWPGRSLARPRAPTAARQRMLLGGRQADARPRGLQARLVVS